MVKTKLKICIFLLLISLVLSIATIVIKNNTRNKDTVETSGVSVESTKDMMATSDAAEQTFVTTQETTEETTEATTEETTETTTKETTQPTTQPATETATIPETTEEISVNIGLQVAIVASDQLGKPYSYGSAGPDAFDTSGLVQYCYQQCGISVPRSNGALASYGYVVEKEDLRPGDAVFFWSSTPGTAEYLGIYIGNGMVIAALNASKPVTQFNMNSEYYTEHFVFARRFY